MRKLTPVIVAVVTETTWWRGHSLSTQFSGTWVLQLINSPRQDFFRDQLQSASTCKDRWCITKELLHS